MTDVAAFYVSYFQQPGRAEAEIEPDVRGWLAGVYATLSAGRAAESAKPWFTVPHGGRLRDRFTSDQLPDWLTEEDLAHYAAEFERSGFTGAHNPQPSSSVSRTHLAHGWRTRSNSTQRPCRVWSPSASCQASDTGSSRKRHRRPRSSCCRG